MAILFGLLNFTLVQLCVLQGKGVGGQEQRDVRSTRELARTDIGWAWLRTDRKSGGGGSCKGCAVPLAYAQSCPAVI